MLSNEFLDEGLGDWWRTKASPWLANKAGGIAKTGILGSQTKGLATDAAEYQKERIRFATQWFSKKFESYFNTVILPELRRSGVVSESKNVVNYDQFDLLLENLINEVLPSGATSVSVSQLAEDYFKSMAYQYHIQDGSPEDKQIKALCNQFEQEFLRTKKFPQNIAVQMGELLYDIAQTQARDERGRIVAHRTSSAISGQAAGMGSIPTKEQWVKIQAATGNKNNVPTIEEEYRTFQFNFTDNKWYEVSSGTATVGSRELQTQLNKLYFQKFFPNPASATSAAT